MRNAVLVVPRGFTEFGNERLRVLPLEDPPGGWLGRWSFYRRTMAALVAKEGANVFYALSGILATPVAMLPNCGHGEQHDAVHTGDDPARPASRSKARLRYWLLRWNTFERSC